MTISELIAELIASASETGDPDAEVRFDWYDDNNVAVAHSDGDSWSVRGLEYIGGPPWFTDGVVVLHP
jgi:hypothetical protein